jgi:hypothetical protein
MAEKALQSFGKLGFTVVVAQASAVRIASSQWARSHSSPM